MIRAAFPAWRVFVFGVDVTEDVNSVTSNWNDARAPNNAQFVLSSVLGRYVVTPQDIYAMYGDIKIDDLTASVLQSEDFLSTISEDGTDAATIVRQNIDRQIRNRLMTGEKRIRDDVKRRVVLAKYSERFRNQSVPGFGTLEHPCTSLKDQALADIRKGNISLQRVNALTGDFLRFPFQAGQCIFHAGDPVRIFFRDPYNPRDWYFEFTGSVTDWQISTDANNMQTVTVTVEDALRAFKFARLTTNWSLFDHRAVYDPARDAGFRNWRTEAFPDATLPEIVYSLAFGTDYAGEQIKQQFRGQSVVDKNGQEVRNDKLAPPIPLSQFRYSVNDKTDYEPPEKGAGAFNFKDSEVILYGPESEVAVQDSTFSKQYVSTPTLGAWQALVDHKLPRTVAEFEPLCIPEQWEKTYKQLFIDSTETRTLDGVVDPEDAMRIVGENPHAFPVDFGRVMMLLPNSLGPGTSRDIMLKTLVSGIATETEFTTRLQILYNVCERIDFSFYATPRGDIVCEMPLYSFRPEDFGKYAKRYTFGAEDTVSVDSHFTDEHIKTQFQTYRHIIKGGYILDTTKDIGRLPSTATLPALIPMFGIRAEKMDPLGYIDTDEAAAYYAYIKLSQRNADAWTENVKTAMRLGLGPNRPCWFEEGLFIATTRGASNSITWGTNGSCQQTLKLNYRRGWSGMMTPEGTQVYEFFGGKAAIGIDYATLFQERQNQSNQSTKPIEEEAVHDHQEETAAGARLDSAGRPLEDEAEIRANEAFCRNEATKLRQALGLDLKISGLSRSPARTKELRNEGKGAALGSLHEHGLGIDFSTKNLDISDTELKSRIETLMADPRSGITKGQIVIDYADQHVHIEYPEKMKTRKTKQDP